MYQSRRSSVRPPVRPCVHMSCKRNTSLTDEVILMKLYTVAVYDQTMYLKEDIPDWMYVKGDEYWYGTGQPFII